MNEEEKKKEVWSNELDAKKHLLEIHDGKVVLGREFKKARLGDREKELVINMLPMAQLAMEICPNKSIGRAIAQMDLHVINALPILNFNSPMNHVLNRYTQWEAPEQENPQEGEAGYLQKLLKQAGSDLKQPVQPE